MAGIHLLTLNVFYYYLKEGLGITAAEIEPFDTYWKEQRSKYKANTDTIHLPKTEFEGKLFHDRNNLGDSNYFFLDCSIRNPDTSSPPKTIIKLKEKVKLPERNKACLGYTSMIYGWVEGDDDALPEELYQELVDDSWQFQRHGKILGSRIIEAWRSRQEWDVPDFGSHVLIILYPNKDTYERSSKLIFGGWVSLLLYRHKIWYSYQESRGNKDKIRKTFNKAVKDLQSYNTYNLQQLGTALESNLYSLTDYSTDLNTISSHQHTLDTNLYNYNLVVKQFTDKVNDDCKINRWANDLKFLEEFSKIGEIKYERQLEKDYAILAPGLAVLTGLTETIRGLVEVQQAEIDRQQNKIIAIVGLGLAASSAAAGIAATQVYQPSQPTSLPAGWLGGDNRIHWGQGLVLSLIPTALAIFVLAVLWCQNHHKSSK